MVGKVFVYIACSLDGFIAGADDELDWLEDYEGAEDTFTPFIANIGAMIMGRRTYDVLTGLIADGADWYYGEMPVLVPTHRPLTPIRPTVEAAGGNIVRVIDEAKTRADGKGVYIDGGAIIRQALDAGLVDEMIITVAPVVLGEGIPLFAGSKRRRKLELIEARPVGAGLVQLRYH